MPDPNAAIQATVDKFITQLHTLVRQAAIAAVTQSLGEVGRSAPARSRAKPAASRASAKPSRHAGEKRPPAELARTVERLLAAIKAKPGQGMEALGAGLGLETRELALPAKKLLAAKKVRTTGAKRATKYFPK